jgi:hypothetical protein
MTTNQFISTYSTIILNNYSLLTLRDENITNDNTNINVFFLFIFYNENRDNSINYEIIYNNDNLSYIHTSWLHLGVAELSCYEIELIYKSSLNILLLGSNYQQLIQRLVVINEALVYSLSNITIEHCGNVSDNFILNLLKICINLNVNICLLLNKNMRNIDINYIYLLESFLLGNTCTSIVSSSNYYAKLFYFGYLSRQDPINQIKMINNLWLFWKRNMKYNHSNTTCISAIISTICSIFVFLNNNLIELLLNYIYKEINIEHISNYNILGLMENLINKLPIKWLLNRNNEKITNLVKLILNILHQSEDNNNNNNNIFNNKIMKILISYINISSGSINNYSSIVKTISSLESIQKNYEYINKSFDVKSYYNDYLNLSLSCSYICNQLVNKYSNINNNNNTNINISNNKNNNNNIKDIERIILFTSEYSCKIIINLSKNNLNKLPSEDFQVLI